MKNSYKKIIGLVIPVLMIIATVIYTTKTFTSLGTVIFLFSLVSIFIFLALLFATQQVFIAWSRFAMVYLPIAAALIIATPTSKESIIDFDKESLAVFLSVILFVVSMVIIGVKSFKLRKK